MAAGGGPSNPPVTQLWQSVLSWGLSCSLSPLPCNDGLNKPKQTLLYTVFVRFSAPETNRSHRT